ncbi:MAG TPA: hypothetical protein VEQ60_25465 [Longimicrobium sp.]|nr:hypothetical protein [Longimicrobium sp.]
MTVKQLAALYGRYLRDALPGTAVRRSLVYLHPVGDLLRGCHFESSGPGGTRFVVHAFVQPLYVPFPSVDLTCGTRLGPGRERWFDLASEPEERVMAEVLRLIRTQAMPLFQRFAEPAHFARHGEELVSNTKAPDFVQAVAYSHLLAGEYVRAAAQLAGMLASLQARPDLRPFEREMLRRNQQLEATLRDRPADAVADLRQWRRETLRGIGLEDEYGPAR